MRFSVDIVDKPEPYAEVPASPEDLHATANRLQQRTERLNGRTRELRKSAQRLKAATARLRDKLQSSFPPPKDGQS
jgi:hypothetical protein